MKRSRLCYGVLSALAIIFGFSLNVCSDTSALQYRVSKIPLMYDNFSGNTSFTTNVEELHNHFYVFVDSDYFPSEHLYDNTQLSQYVLNYSNNDGSCSPSSFKQFPRSSVTSRYNLLDYSFGGYSPANPYLPYWINVNPCLVSNSSLFGSPVTLTPDFKIKAALSNLLPYRFSYDSIYLTDTYVDDGLHYNTKFDLVRNLFGTSDNVPDHIYKVNIPLGSPDFIVQKGTPLSVSGEFIFDFDDPSVDLSSYMNISFNYGIYISQVSGGSYEIGGTCSTDLKRDDPSDPLSVWSFTYSCDAVVDDYGGNLFTVGSLVSPYLTISFDYLTDDINPFYQFIFDSMLTVTDYDSTPASSTWNSTPVSGASPHSAPGSAYQNALSGKDPDYNSSLIDMFDFTALNPFQPIFGMFNHGSDCVSIPTIASMIHSNETTVCPWFDSNVRNIATPVVGISGMMLLFGFFVRWLGASSGNFFEDSRNEEVSNQGGRWGHFKRGGK